ncbi:3-deoxy-8-phosphooctulonate synthase [Methanocalculus sp.]|uniref:3-deoxy-8-phosphooctulonate synthase n=1 Tax=Methanocalculus sp. TaxID=2004547 RepID=UPI002635A233|nr:3-deoxy-8-phosphooctulonate synthase [Methanocalculus sp.]MDG6250213.1 3-deoxy-8-phosphooctulonate synthase [Methanocalculus sp.]
MHTIKVGNITIGANNPLVLFGGPCVIESEEHLIDLGMKIKAVAEKHNIPIILKASFDKANRTSIKSYRGPGLKKGLKILQNVKDELKLPIISDIHEPNQVQDAAEVLDILQIPAFLCRQTDLLCEAAKTGKPVNIKKGQFLAPRDVHKIIEKIEFCGNKNIILTERGTSFGYNNLVVDMRSLVIMRSFGYPIMFDATHSVQIPGGLGNCSGGERKFVPYLTRAAAAVGIDALFMEIHDDPDNAPCDGHNMIHINDLEDILTSVVQINKLVNTI